MRGGNQGEHGSLGGLAEGLEGEEKDAMASIALETRTKLGDLLRSVLLAPRAPHGHAGQRPLRGSRDGGGVRRGRPKRHGPSHSPLHALYASLRPPPVCGLFTSPAPGVEDAVS